MKFFPKPPKILEEKDDWARFSIEGLYPGYGITIGNSLRRVLFSSLSGTAATQVKIKGVSHEFSTIPGVMEDVITIMMNIRQMRFRSYTDEPQKIFLKIKGKKEKEVRGSDFDIPSQLELINKSCHIATITDKKAELEMEIQVEKGVGYQPANRLGGKKKLEVGSLALDAIFTPIKRVNYQVENMRVGERTDFDRLYLEITTDGTITPKEAFYRAVDILVKHFTIFLDSLEPAQKKKGSSEKKIEEEIKPKTKSLSKEEKETKGNKTEKKEAKSKKEVKNNKKKKK